MILSLCEDGWFFFLLRLISCFPSNSPRMSEERMDLDKPLWDQTTFIGRLKHFAWVTDYRTVIVPRSRLEEAKTLLQQYRYVEPLYSNENVVILRNFHHWLHRKLSIDENVAKWYFVFSKTNDICRNANFVVTGWWRQSWHHDDSNVSIWWRHHDCYDVFREGKEPPGTTLEDVKYARKLYESSYHPDSGELGNVIGRMSFQVPGGMIITAGMLQFYRYGVRTLHIFGIMRYNVTRGSQRLNKPMHQTTVQGRNMRLMASQIPGNLINSIFSK